MGEAGALAPATEASSRSSRPRSSSDGECHPVDLTNGGALSETCQSAMIRGGRSPAASLGGSKPESGKGCSKPCNSRAMPQGKSIGRSTASIAPSFVPINMRQEQKGGSKSRGMSQDHATVDASALPSGYKMAAESVLVHLISNWESSRKCSRQQF